MKVIGMDLSGPSNIADTHLVVLEEQGAEYHFVSAIEGADDQAIFHSVCGSGKTVIVIYLNERVAWGCF